MPPKKLSGAQFRKLRKARVGNHTTSSTRLNKWLYNSISSDPSDTTTDTTIVKDSDQDKACFSAAEAHEGIHFCFDLINTYYTNLLFGNG